jgi:hypothetical protein
MTEVLGYDKYGVGAADYGALVGARLGHKYADSLYGIHLGSEMPPAMFQGDRFWDLSGGQQTEDLPEATRARLVRRNNIYVSHVAAHLLDGQTLTHGLNDSPVGMLAWVLKRPDYHPLLWLGAGMSTVAAFQPETLITGVAPARSAGS